MVLIIRNALLNRHSKIVLNAVWAFKCMLDNEELMESMEIVTRQSVLALLFYVQDDNVHILYPVMNSLKTISKNEKYAELLVDCDIIKVIESIFEYSEGLLQINEACEILCNLTNKSKILVNELVDCKLYLLIVKLFNELNKNAIYVICNCFLYADNIQSLVDDGILINCLQLLDLQNRTINFLILNVIKQILITTKGSYTRLNIIRQLVETGTIEKIEEIYYMRNIDNATLAEQILHNIHIP